MRLFFIILVFAFSLYKAHAQNTVVSVYGISNRSISGVVNEEGKINLPIIYEQIIPNKFGYYIVSRNGYYGVFDRDFREIVPCKYAAVAPMVGDYCWVVEKYVSGWCLLHIPTMKIVKESNASFATVLVTPDGHYAMTLDECNSKPQLWNQYGNQHECQYEFVINDIGACGSELVLPETPPGYFLIVLDKTQNEYGLYHLEIGRIIPNMGEAVFAYRDHFVSFRYEKEVTIFDRDWKESPDLFQVYPDLSKKGEIEFLKHYDPSRGFRLMANGETHPPIYPPLQTDSPLYTARLSTDQREIEIVDNANKVVDQQVVHLATNAEYPNQSWRKNENTWQLLSGYDDVLYSIEADTIAQHGRFAYVTKQNKTSLLDMKTLVLRPFEYVQLFGNFGSFCLLLTATKKWYVGYSDAQVLPSPIDCSTEYDPYHSCAMRYAVENQQFLSARRNGFYGLLHEDGTTILPFEYDEISLYDKYFTARKGSNWLIFDGINRTELGWLPSLDDPWQCLEPSSYIKHATIYGPRNPSKDLEFHYSESTGTIISSTIEGRPWSLLNKACEQRISNGEGAYPQFFADDRRLVAHNTTDTISYIYDTSGQLIKTIPCIYLWPVNMGYVGIAKGGKQCLVTQNGTIFYFPPGSNDMDILNENYVNDRRSVYDAQGESLFQEPIERLESLPNGWFVVSFSDSALLVDEQMQSVSTLDFKRLYHPSQYGNTSDHLIYYDGKHYCATDLFGLPLTAAVYEWIGCQATLPNKSRIPFKRDGKWGYFSPQFKEIIKPQFDFADAFLENGYAIVLKENKYVWIDTNGVVQRTYWYGKDTPFTLSIIVYTYHQKICSPVSVVLNDCYPYEYEMLSNFYLTPSGANGAIVYRIPASHDPTKMNYGLINYAGQNITNAIYSAIYLPYLKDAYQYDFNESACVYARDGKYGLLSLDGKEITLPIFDWIEQKWSDSQRIPCGLNGRNTFINCWGSEVK